MIGVIASARRRSSSGGLSNKWRINVTNVATSGSWVSILEMEWAQSFGGTDATGSGTPSASAADTAGGNGVSKAFDNSLSTTNSKYQSGTATLPIWIEYDFASAVTIEEVRLWPYSASGAPTDAPTGFDVQYYDGSTWQTYWSVPDAGKCWVQNTNELIFNRYIAANPGSTAWRISVTATQNGGTSWCSIQEIQLRGSVGGSDLTAANSSDGGQAMANANGGPNNWPWWAFDGTSAPWQSGAAPSSGSPKYIGYRFPSQVNIAQVSIQCTSTPGDAPKNFTIDYWNGTGWTTAKTVTGATWTASQTQLWSVP